MDALQFKTAFNGEIEALWKKLESYPFESPLAYADWLAQTYYLVSHTTRLLAVAASRCGSADDAMHHICLAGIGEERDHEAIAIADLRHLGYSLTQFPELPETTAVYACQYFKTHYGDPASLFGHALLLEGLCERHGVAWLERLEKTYDKKALRFLAVHAVHDADHFSQGTEQLGRLPQARIAAILANKNLAATLYGNLLDALVHRMRLPVSSEAA